MQAQQNSHFTEEQLAYLSSLHFINRLDDNLKAVSSVSITRYEKDIPPRIRLLLELYFYDKKVDTLSFDLHNYNYEDIISLAQNISENEFLLQEIDNFLAGDIVE